MFGDISGNEPLPMARDTSSKEQICKRARTSPLRTYVLHIGIILVIDDLDTKVSSKVVKKLRFTCFLASFISINEHMRLAIGTHASKKAPDFSLASTTGIDQMVKRAQMIQILSPQG